ncbi:hypothetical protein ACH4SK_07350 [Streptomyces inhibens]|uniref:hypothetical protein n=1 Tax=Streptomyces inhibens TaxID=2293571 RepID=UPI00378C8F48
MPARFSVTRGGGAASGSTVQWDMDQRQRFAAPAASRPAGFISRLPSPSTTTAVRPVASEARQGFGSASIRALYEAVERDRLAAR